MEFRKSRCDSLHKHVGRILKVTQRRVLTPPNSTHERVRKKKGTMMCKAIVLGIVIVVHALESEVENSRMNVYRSEEASRVEK